MAIIIVLSCALCLVTAAAVVAFVMNARIARERDRATRESIEALRAQFAALASSELADKTRELSDQNRNEVAIIADNLRAELLRSMDDLRTAANAAVQSTRQVGDAMQMQISGVRDSAERLGRKAEGLEAALSGSTKRQGLWGEAMLSSVFKASGLRKGIDYVLQEGTRETGIPDSEVTDPAGRILVIDSKASVTDFLAACNATDEATRRKHLAAHLESVKKHIRELSAKNYVEKLRKAHPGKTYLNVVAMFVPSEAAHAAAMAEDPALGEYAYNLGVAIVTPLTLLAYLRIVSLAWQQDSVERNHAEIIAKAELLLARADQCVNAMEDLGKSLESARGQYEKAMGLIGCRDGAHSFVKPAQDLVGLGIKLQKAKSDALTGKNKFDSNHENDN